MMIDRRSRFWWAQGFAWLAVWWDLGLYFGALINGKWWWAAADFLLFAAAAWTWWLWRYRAPDRDALSNPDRSPSPEAKS